MPTILEAGEIRARTERRKGRAMTALNALHDTLQGYCGTLTQGEYETIIDDLQDKLNDMKRVTGYRPIPFDRKTATIRNKMDEILGTTDSKRKRSDSTRARPPRKPRERPRRQLEPGEGLEFEDI